jgi:hypothetical protein
LSATVAAAASGSSGATAHKSSHNSASSTPATTENSGEISKLGLAFRGVDREKMAASANAELAYNLGDQLNASGLFEPVTLGEIKNEGNGTFTFVTLLTLKRPLKF